MKTKTYHTLFRFFPFLSDKTNGAPSMIKYKLMLGMLIIGLSATSCHKPKAVATCNEVVPKPEQVDTCYNIYVSPDVSENEVLPYGVIETPPVSPVGDIDKFTEWMRENIEYPESMIANEEQGRVTVRFIIDKKGKITNINILRTFSPDADKEVMRLLKLSKAWRPGEHRGYRMNTEVTIPVVFRLPQD
ncbi:energy transducer TonB [Dysgonomonas sp. 25]|uniref:energy transducer TonB n=1 Tax=Dysgonomonas sp. 25 TaxID=2302933 RepID=UPI0013D65D26|nr:energy transducer TonB [Dysgonomonas sp. 25]NDV67392.1 energy transducer TonB [Dysgonomonas sp. 25]